MTGHEDSQNGNKNLSRGNTPCRIAWTMLVHSDRLTRPVTDYHGDTSSSRVGRNFRSYRCNTPSATTFSLVDPTDVSPLSETEGHAVTFAVDYGYNQGASSDTATGDGSSGLSDNGKENDSPFSSVFISWPNAAFVSSPDIESECALTDCDSTSDQRQTALAYCTWPMSDEDCSCSHVIIGGAADTVVKLHPAASCLTPVSFLAFSDRFHGFTAIEPSSGSVYMRGDMTDMPGYWDSTIDSQPDSGTSSVHKRDLNFHHPRGTDKCWFGSLTPWPAKLNTLTGATLTQFSIKKRLAEAFFFSLLRTNPQLVLPQLLEQSRYECASRPSFLRLRQYHFQALAVSTQFEYYLEATVVLPAAQQAYMYFKAAEGKYQELVMAVHLEPSVQLGVGGSPIDAQVFVEADMFAGLSIAGGVSNTVVNLVDFFGAATHPRWVAPNAFSETDATQEETVAINAVYEQMTLDGSKERLAAESALRVLQRRYDELRAKRSSKKTPGVSPPS
ncbi:hypothetical protein DFH07DRAFT_956109 [Mycena maculata]|uniref:Uncharacterized protein n=1 Tax=Mycena maculata TaxID=230809 RepID=A0AAD7NKB8_9AGAR|nr:hypothetical protein DFH07DRAFT_956109 [Mycena maculata]